MPWVGCLTVAGNPGAVRWRQGSRTNIDQAFHGGGRRGVRYPFYLLADSHDGPDEGAEATHTPPANNPSTASAIRSRPFAMPAKCRIAVMVINHLGDEVMKVFRV